MTSSATACAPPGFDVFVPQGTYFATVDIRSVGGDDGLEFCRSLPERCGVVAVPSSVFYEDPATGRHLVRFAFCKRIEVLTEAAERLASLAMTVDPRMPAAVAARAGRPGRATRFGGPVDGRRRTSEHRRRVRLLHPRGRPGRRRAPGRLAGTARGPAAPIAVRGRPRRPARPPSRGGARTAGTRRPACLAVLGADDGFDLPTQVMERAPGTTMLDAFTAKPWRARRLVDQLATLALRLHALPTDDFPPDAGDRWSTTA